MPDRSIRSRNPSSWPAKLVEVLTFATTHEIFMPFENMDRVRGWRKLLKEVRRSFREHSHPLADSINSLQSVLYRTADILPIRPAYCADPSTHPYTVCVSSGLGFLSNLEQATPGEEVGPQPSTSSPLPTPHSHHPLSQIELDRELERQLAELMSEEISNHGNEAIDFLKSRRGK